MMKFLSREHIEILRKKYLAGTVSSLSRWKIPKHLLPEHWGRFGEYSVLGVFWYAGETDSP